MGAVSSLMSQSPADVLNTLAGANATAAIRGTSINPKDPKAKARAAAEDFESVFLNSMFNQMFTGIDGEGPFGGKGAGGVWRSFLTNEYAKAFSKAGGIGISDKVYQELLARQEGAKQS